MTETSVPVDRNTRKYKVKMINNRYTAIILVTLNIHSNVYLGFAFVTFMMPEHAVTAFSELDGSTFKGRLLHLVPAKPKEETEEGTGGPGSEFKKQKDAKLKASAGNSYNWNSLFLRVNAVADVMEEQYGVDKAQVMMDDDDKISEFYWLTVFYQVQ